MDYAETDFDAAGGECTPEGRGAFADALERAILGELSEMRELMAGLTRRVAAQAGAAETPEDLARLNTAAVKAARAHRQIAVLQLEILGKRPVAGRRGQDERGEGGREPPVERGSGEGPKIRVRSQRERFPNGLPFHHDDYNDYDDYTDDERRELRTAQFFQRLEPVVAAMDEDFTAAGREDIVHESPATKYKLIFYVPHPATDRAIAAARPDDICTIFAMGDRLPPVAGTGPPEVWERYNEGCRLRWELQTPES